jgi:hypothetical protein
VDAFTIGTSTAGTTTYNFEPAKGSNGGEDSSDG